MNIAIFASAFYPHVGGVEELVRQLSHGYGRLGHRAIIMTNRWPRSLPAYEDYEGIPIHRLAMRVPVGSFKAHLDYHLTHNLIFKQMKSVLKKTNVDLLHVQCISSNAYYALVAKRRLGLPLVVTLQGELTMDATGWYDLGFGRTLLRTVLNEAEAITACSMHTLKEAENFFGSPFGKRGRVVYNGVNLDEFSNISPYRHPHPYFLAIGRFVPQKGFDVLLRAFAKVLQAGNKTQDLLLAGDGVERNNLESLSAKLGIADHVYFLGKVDHSVAVTLFSGSSFVVLPSRLEPMGIVNLEAMASGKAIIASCVGGVPEVVHDGETGLLIPPGDIDALSSAMIRLITKSELRNRLGAAGRARVNDFSWPTITEQYLDIYNNLTQR